MPALSVELKPIVDDVLKSVKSLRLTPDEAARVERATIAVANAYAARLSDTSRASKAKLDADIKVAKAMLATMAEGKAVAAWSAIKQAIANTVTRLILLITA